MKREHERLYSLDSTDPQAKLKQKYADFTGGRSYLEDCLFGMIDPDFINLSHTDAFRGKSP